MDGYFPSNREVLANVAARTLDHQVRTLDGEITCLVYHMHENAKIVGGSLIGVNVRVSARVCRKPKG